METFLPDLAVKAEFPLGPKRKAPFDQLQRPLQRQERRDQEMKVIGHQHKFMQQIFLLRSVAKQNIK